MRRNPKNAKFLPHPAGLHTQLDRILRNQGVPDTYLRGLRPQLDEAVAEADDKLMLSPGDLLPWREWTESSWLPGEKEAEILKWTKSFREGGYTGPAATRKAKNRVGNWDTGSRHHPRISYEAEGTYSATIPTVDGDPLIHRVAFANSSDGWDGLQKWYSAQVALAIKQGKLDPTSAHGRAVLDSLPELRLKYVSPKLADVVAAAEQMRPYAATTIEEAETYLKALGVGKVSLANLDIRIANAVVDTIRDEYVRFPNHEASLHSVTTAALARGSTMMSMAYGGSLEIRWKKMDYDRLAATAKNNADAGGWSRNRRAQMETNIRAAEEIVTEQQKLAKDALAKYAATQDLSHLEEARRRQRYARKYGGYLRSYRRDLAKIESTPKGVEQVWSCGWGSGDSPERITRELVRHEMGHRHHATQPGARQWASDAFGVCKRLGQFPSEYSQTNSSELFADSYGFYMTGYEHRLPAHVLTYFETHFGEAKAKKTT